MASSEHIEILNRGVKVWNHWRRENRLITPDLSRFDLGAIDLRDSDLRKANLRMTNLRGADLRWANLRIADLKDSDLGRANLRMADLSRSDLRGADLRGADLRDSDLSGSDLRWADLKDANLSKSNLFGADLAGAILVNSNLSMANLINSTVYGISAWNANLDRALQKDLIISNADEPIITVDNLEVAQFIYLLINNQNIRAVIDTLTTKSVLILGMFTSERKVILNALRKALRQKNYLPILVDFENSASRDVTETIGSLARLARFIIADLTNTERISQVLQSLVPNLPSVTVRPIIQNGQKGCTEYELFKHSSWVMPLLEYEDEAWLLANLTTKIIEPAEAKASFL